VFEDRVLERIFGCKREEVVRGWKRMHNEELHNLYASPNIVRDNILRALRWAGNAAHMEDEKCIQNFGCNLTSWVTISFSRTLLHGVGWFVHQLGRVGHGVKSPITMQEILRHTFGFISVLVCGMLLYVAVYNSYLRQQYG
jgi:hypothetical protein